MSTKRDANHPVIVDGSTLRLIPTPKPRRIPLKTLAQVRNEMSRKYRQLDAGEVDSQDCSRAVYILAQIGRIIEVADLEERILQLEGGNNGIT